MRPGFGIISLALVAAFSAGVKAAQVATVVVVPEADAFVRSAAPTNNYGGAGAISVSGSAAVNATNQQNGLFDSLVRFPMSEAVGTLDAALGTHDWVVLGATLCLTEFGAPPSPIFNRGVGAFEVRWIAADNWIEGTGVPVTPTTNGVTWNDVPALLNPAVDVSVGQFTNAGVDGRLLFSLPMKPAFVSDVRSGGPVDLYLTAASPQIGFTAYSRSISPSNNAPMLSIFAAVNPNPLIDTIALDGTNIVLRFRTVSNWSYAVEASSALQGVWTNVATVPAQTTNGSNMVMDAVTSLKKFYRLSVTH